MVLKIRCSSTGRSVNCPGSLIKSHSPFDAPNDFGTAGSAAHEALMHLAEGIEPDLEAIAAKYSVDLEELSMRYYFGRKIWNGIQKMFPNPEAEHYVSGFAGEGWYSQGTTDLLSRSYDEAGVLLTMAVLDWKTGRSNDEHEHQLLSYAANAVAQYGMPASGYVGGLEVHVLNFETFGHKFDLKDIEWLRGRLNSSVEHKRRFAPGLHCKFCPRTLQCDARERWLRSGATSLVELPKGEITPTVLAHLYPRFKVLEKAMKDYASLLNEALDDGPIDMGDGTQMIMTRKVEERISYKETSPLFEDFSNDERATFLTVSKGKLLDLIGNKKESGTKKAAKEAFIEQVRGKGGILNRVKNSRRIQKIPLVIEEKESESK